MDIPLLGFRKIIKLINKIFVIKGKIVWCDRNMLSSNLTYSNINTKTHEFCYIHTFRHWLGTHPGTHQTLPMQSQTTAVQWPAYLTPTYKHTNKHTHFMQKAARPTGGACKSQSHGMRSRKRVRNAAWIFDNSSLYARACETTSAGTHHPPLLKDCDVPFSLVRSRLGPSPQTWERKARGVVLANVTFWGRGRSRCKARQRASAGARGWGLWCLIQQPIMTQMKSRASFK